MSDEHDDYVEPPSITLEDNDDPSLIDTSVRAFIDAENTKARSIFSQIAASSDEREQMQLYSDTMLVVYRAAFLATRALLEARSVQLGAMRELNEKAQRSLSKAEYDLAESRSQLQRQRSATIKPGNASAPIVINVDASKPGSKRIEHDDAGRIVRIVDDEATA